MNLYLHRPKAEIHLISFLLLLVYEIDFARTAFNTPTLKFGEPTPTAIEVFIIDEGCGITTQYLVQYRIRGSSIINTATTGAENIYATRLTGLQPNTVYEIRARANQVNSITSVTESDATFSSWNTTSTEPLSVFGSVVLNNVNYNGNTENSESWNASLATIQNGYRDIRNLGISILRIEDNSGKARVHYRIKVLETELTVGDTKYQLSGADFTDSYINSGDTPTGVAYVYRSGDEWILTYQPVSSCSKIVERYMKVSADQGQPIGDIHLNVASSEVATADEHDGLRIGNDGRGNKCLWNYHLSPCNKQFTQFHRCMESCDTWYSSWWTVRCCKSRCKCWLNEEIKTYRSKCCSYSSDDIYNRCYRFKDVLYYYNYNYGGRGYNYRYGGQLYNYNNRNYNYEGRKRNLQKKSHHNVAFALYRNYIYGGKRYNYNNRNHNYGGRGHNPQRSSHGNVRFNLYRRYY